MTTFPASPRLRQGVTPTLRHLPAVGIALALLLGGGVRAGRAAETDPLVNTAHQLAPIAPAWAGLADAFAHHADTTADFTERRFFPFKKEPVELKGESRVSVTRGLSLHYTAPDELTVILDDKGVLNRAAAGEKTPPADPQAAAANAALLHIARLELTALAKDFELYGQHDGSAWTLVLVPRTKKMTETVGRITVTGDAATIRRIEIRRTPTQAIEIVIAPPRPAAAFTAEELKKFFR